MEQQVIQQLSVLLTHQEGLWVARCLQFDVVGQGDRIDDALESLGLCLTGHILMNVRDRQAPLAGLPSAPPKIWHLFNQARQLRDGQPFRMPAELNEIPEDLRESVPEPWRLPRPHATDVRIY
jgi:hypothetical protein